MVMAVFGVLVVEGLWCVGGVMVRVVCAGVMNGVVYSVCPTPHRSTYWVDVVFIPHSTMPP